MARINTPEELARFRQGVLSKRDPDKPCISVCAGTGCLATGASGVVTAFRNEIEEQGVYYSMHGVGGDDLEAIRRVARDWLQKGAAGIIDPNSAADLIIVFEPDQPTTSKETQR